MPNDKILALTKLKALGDDKAIVAKMMTSVFDRVGNIVGKGENAGYQHFLLFPQCFQKLTVSGLLTLGIVWERVNPLPHMPILGSSNSAANKDMM